MNAIDNAELQIAALNQSLAEQGDPARIRFMTTEPSWDEGDDRLRILAFWELPEPEGSVWPTETLWEYRHMIQELFDEDEVRVASYFRTRDELESGEHHAGWRVPELA